MNWLLLAGWTDSIPSGMQQAWAPHSPWPATAGQTQGPAGLHLPLG